MTDLHGKTSFSKTTNFSVISNFFEGLVWDISEAPSKLFGIFKNFKHVKTEIIAGVYFIKFRGYFIANIKDYKITFTPGIYLHHELFVFKTYNKILKTIVGDAVFLKLIDGKWVLCRDESEATND